MTLAWFSPINPTHRNLREAKLEIIPGGVTWGKEQLQLARQDGDRHQIKRGTVQHEVLESEQSIFAYQEGEMLRLHVVCKKDATERLGEKIPYGLAVTLEVKEGVDIPIYQQIRMQLRAKITVSP